MQHLEISSKYYTISPSYSRSQHLSFKHSLGFSKVNRTLDNRTMRNSATVRRCVKRAERLDLTTDSSRVRGLLHRKRGGEFHSKIATPYSIPAHTLAPMHLLSLAASKVMGYTPRNSERAFECSRQRPPSVTLWLPFLIVYIRITYIYNPGTEPAVPYCLSRSVRHF